MMILMIIFKLLLLLSYILITLSYLSYRSLKVSCCRTDQMVLRFAKGTNKNNDMVHVADIDSDDNDNDNDNDDSVISIKKKKKRRQPMGYTHISNATRTNTINATVDSISIGQLISTYNISFTVYGEPTPLSRHMLSKGRMYNPSVMHQREFAKACESFLPLKPLEGPIEAKMIFYFSRPKYQFRTGRNSHLLKDGISNWHNTRKDLDNLIKFVLDSLNKKAYLDDSQVLLVLTNAYHYSHHYFFIRLLLYTLLKYTLIRKQE